MVIIDDVIIFVTIGAFAGTMSGLLGIGGGMVVVPSLAFAFHLVGFPQASIMQMAAGTSLAVMVCTAQASARAHHREVDIEWGIYQKLVAGIIPGTLIGALIADKLHTHMLSIILGILLIVVSMRIFLLKEPKPTHHLPNRFFMFAVGLIVGAKSGLLGLGGGVITIPFLTYCNVSMRRAVGVSILCSFTIAVIGTLATLYTGLDYHGLPGWRTGYVFWPAVLCIAIPSMIMAPYAARWSHKIPERRLKRFFAIFLLLAGISAIS